MIPLNYYLLLSAFMFCCGVLGVVVRRNAIVVFMSIELMLNSVNLTLVAYSSFLGDATGQMLVFFVMVVAAAEVAVGLGIMLAIYRHFTDIDVNNINLLKW